MKKYILLYGDKKYEDNICLTNMFKSNKKINLGWTDFDYNHNMKIIDDLVSDKYEEFIFSGLEIGWDRLIVDIKNKYPKLIIKVICTTQDSLLYYDYERNNFFRLLELSKEKIVNKIGFLRESQYKLYSELGYSCGYIKENYILEKKVRVKKNKNKKIVLGIYPLNYTWDKNIFNQLCVGKFLDNSVVRYNLLDERMKDFMDTMKIESEAVKVNDENIVDVIKENDVVISASFTEYMHPVFFIAMEMGIPCLIGNNSDLFNKSDLKDYIVTSSEDNAIINASIISKLLENKEKVFKLYDKWKQKYNMEAKKSLEQFIG